MEKNLNQQPNQANPTLLANEKFVERQRMEAEIEKDAKILFQHQKHSKIDSFTNYFEFLHNNYLSPVLYDGMLFPSATHAFQAARSSDDRTRKAILNAENLLVVLKIAKRIDEPENWKLKRLKIMEQIVRDKFRRSRELQEKLKATANRDIIMTYQEDNDVNQYWGVVNNKGQNQLGRILTKIRNDVKDNQELLNWISFSFDFLTDQDLMPEITLDIFKEGKQIDCKILKNKSFYIIGCLPSSDLVLEHPSISRIHAALVCDNKLGVILIDLRSKAGTRLDGDLINDNIPYRMKNGKKIKFGLSTREYSVTIDVKKMKKLYVQQKKIFENELELIDKLENSILDNDILKQSFGLENNDDNENIFIGNVPYEATEKSLKELFEEFGPIKNIKIPTDWKTGHKKGHAFIQYEEPEMAKLAVKTGIIAFNEDKDKRIIDLSENGKKPRSLRIKYATPKPIWENENKNKNFKAGKDFEKNMIKDVETRIKNKRKRSSSSSSSSGSDSSSSDSSSSTVKKSKNKKKSSSSENSKNKKREIEKKAKKYKIKEEKDKRDREKKNNK